MYDDDVPKEPFLLLSGNHDNEKGGAIQSVELVIRSGATAEAIIVNFSIYDQEVADQGYFDDYLDYLLDHVYETETGELVGSY